MLEPSYRGLQRQLDSLLELSSHIADAEPMEILNTALLSVMGRIGVFKACIALPEDGGFTAPVHLCKGLEPVSLPADIAVELHRPEPRSLLAQAGVAMVAPLLSGSRVVGVLCLGPSMHVDAFDDSAVSAYLEIARVMIGTTAHNASLVRSLKQSARALEHRTLMITSLFETARDFATARNHEELFRLLWYRVMGHLMVSRVAIFLREPINGSLVLEQRGLGSPYGSSLVPIYDHVIDIDRPIRIADLPPNDAQAEVLRSASLAMVAPLTVHGVSKGVIVTGEPLSARVFTQEDLAYLEAVGSTAMISIEHIAKQRLDDELAIASEIQRGLLPQAPSFSGLDIAALHRPSGRVGGDYYDVIPLDEHRVLIAIADVAGKGIPAALLMANVQAALTVLAATDVSLSAMMHRINSVVCENTEPEVFITMWVGVIDTRRQEMSYVNAGHHPPLLVDREGAVGLMREGGVLTGVLPDPPPYRMGVQPFGRDALLVLYTDGVVEARTDGEEFGMDRLTDLVLRHHHETSAVIVEAIRQAAEAHHRDGTPDDVTIVAVRPN